MAIPHSHNTMAFAFGMLGNVISFMVYLAPLPTFYRIYKKKSTQGFQSLPYLVALFSSMLWLYYAMLKTDAVLLITINSFGCVVETIYVAIFILYAPKQPRNSTIKLFLAMVVGLFSLILLVTHFAFSAVLRVQVLGWICVCVSVSVFAAPLTIVAQVIRTKSVEFMPFNLSFFLTVSAVMWFAYGLFLKDICIALPNVVGFGLGLVQMMLYAIYRKGNKKQEILAVVIEEKNPPEPLKNPNIIVLTPVTISAEVLFPADAQSYIVDMDHDVHKEEKQEQKEEEHEKALPVLPQLHTIECPV